MKKEPKYIPVDPKHKGALITDFKRILKLAYEKKSVFIEYTGRYIGKSTEHPTGIVNTYTSKSPAAWLINWPAVKLHKEMENKSFYEYTL